MHLTLGTTYKSFISDCDDIIKLAYNVPFESFNHQW